MYSTARKSLPRCRFCGGWSPSINKASMVAISRSSVRCDACHPFSLRSDPDSQIPNQQKGRLGTFISNRNRYIGGDGLHRRGAVFRPKSLLDNLVRDVGVVERFLGTL